MNKSESCINTTLNKVTIFVKLFCIKQTPIYSEHKSFDLDRFHSIYITIKAKPERTKQLRKSQKQNQNKHGLISFGLQPP